MLNKSILDAVNKQIQTELTAAYGYLALSNWFDQQLLKGFAAYFRKQMHEEQEHALKFLKYVQDRGGTVQLGQVNAPKQQFESVLDAVKSAQEAERNNTACINAIHALAVKEGDLATQEMLRWFIGEQVEEEQWAEEFVQMAEKINGHVGSLFMWDHRVSKLATGGED